MFEEEEIINKIYDDFIIRLEEIKKDINKINIQLNNII